MIGTSLSDLITQIRMHKIRMLFYCFLSNLPKLTLTAYNKYYKRGLFGNQLEFLISMSKKGLYRND